MSTQAQADQHARPDVASRKRLGNPVGALFEFGIGNGLGPRHHGDAIRGLARLLAHPLLKAQGRQGLCGVVPCGQAWVDGGGPKSRRRVSRGSCGEQWLVRRGDHGLTARAQILSQLDNPVPTEKLGAVVQVERQGVAHVVEVEQDLAEGAAFAALAGFGLQGGKAGEIDARVHVEEHAGERRAVASARHAEFTRDGALGHQRIFQRIHESRAHLLDHAGCGVLGCAGKPQRQIEYTVAHQRSVAA